MEGAENCTVRQSFVSRGGILILCFLFLFSCHFFQVNLVLDDAVEYTPDPSDHTNIIKTALETEILLNGNQIAVLVPGGTGPEDSLVSQAG